MSETDNYERYCRRLCGLVYTELVPKVATFDYFTRFAHREDPDYLETEPMIHMFVSGMMYDVHLSIYRLIVAGSGGKNIPKFLSYTRSNLRRIRFKRTMTLDDIDRHEALIRGSGERIERLKKIRDKFFAHYDNEYFFDPDVLNDHAPFTNLDVISLLRVMQDIMGDHHEALNGSRLLSLEGAFYVGAERVCTAMLRSARGMA